MIGFTPLEEINLECAKKASNLLDTFWCHPFFNNFKQFRYLHLLQTITKISSDSLHAHDPDSFFLGKDKPSEIYNELYNRWFESLDKLDDSLD